MFKFLYLAVVLSTPLAVSAQAPVTTCDTYVFNCKWDIYQCGAKLGSSSCVDTPDACDHSGAPTFRPLAKDDCDILISKIKGANYTGVNATGLDYSKIKCRETKIVDKNKVIGVGDTLTSWGCYNKDVNYIATSTDKVQKTCAKTKSYFTYTEPFLGNGFKCGCGTNGNSSNCPAIDPTMKCLPGYICLPVSTTLSQCKRDPMADHSCCQSLNYEGDDVAPGKCCLGAKATKGKCVSGNEFKNVTYTGICPVGANLTRKENVMEANLCLKTPDLMVPKQNETQGDCMIGLKCDGTKGYGFCKWWDKPEYTNSCNMKRWTKGCEPGDCQVGTYCAKSWNDNGVLQFTQCRPMPPGMPDTEPHNGLCTNPPSRRIFKQTLGKCSGVVGTVWGDPHVITFDKLGYNCQGSGDFVLTENCLFKVHSRFEGMASKGMQIAQTVASAIQTGHATPNDTSDDSLIQLYFPYKWFENKSNILSGAYQVYQSDCPVRILLNGVPLEKPPVGTDGKLKSGVVWKQTPLFNISTLVVKTATATETQGDFYIVDYANGGTAKFRIHGGGSGTTWGCVMSVDLCLPKQDVSCYSNTVGLMGTPDGDRANDWMIKTNESKIVYVPADTSGTETKKKQWDYCTKNWCITDGSSILPVSNENVPGVMSDNFYAAQCTRAYPGDLDYAFCYNITRCDKFLLKYPTVKKGVTKQEDLPPEYLACCVECIGGAEDANCKGEEATITTIKENSAVTPDGKGPIITVPTVTCNNLGTELSGPTGVNAWTGENQLNAQCSNAVKCIGFDDSYSVFVGGDLTVKRAETFEGRTYCGGSFKTLVTPQENDSIRYMGWAPCGSQMCPNTMKTVLEVCGNMNLAFGPNEGIDIMMMEGMSGYVRFGGDFLENGKKLEVKTEGTQKLCSSTKLRSQGMVSQADGTEESELCFKKDQLLTPLKGKSKYWASPEYKAQNVFITGTVTVDTTAKEVVLNGPVGATGCTIVIDLDGAILNQGTSTGWKIVFGDKITGTQTVLINVRGTSVIVSGFDVMVDKIDDTTTMSGYNFDNRIMTKTLWNFADATYIQFGQPAYSCTSDLCKSSGIPDKEVSFEWQGSILAPLANVDFNIKSHLGRLIVGGSLTVDHPDATFYNYMFNPKGDKCELPKVPSDTCVPIVAPPPLANVVPQCVMDTYIETDVGSTICLAEGYSNSIVRLDGQLGYDGTEFADGSGIFYGLKLSEDGSTLQFNVNNPFSEKADIYVKHETYFPGTTWLDPSCEATFQRPHCLQQPFAEDGSRQFEVGCIARSNGEKYAQVYVFFATTAPEVKSYTKTKLEKVDGCCHPTEYDPTYKFVEFMFKIDCGCPNKVTGDAARMLRGSV